MQKIAQFVNRPGNVILNGYDFELPHPCPEPEIGIFRITYNGSLYSSQPIEVFLEAIESVIRCNEQVISIEVHFPGLAFDPVQKKRVEALTKGIQSHVFITPRLPKEEVIDLQLRSDVLLMVAHNNIKGIPSSKLFEYIGLERTILVCPTDNDVIEEMVTSTATGHTVQSVDECIRVLTDLIHSHAMFMGAYIAARLAEKLEKEFFHTEHTSGLIFEPEQYNQTDRSIIQTVFNTAKNTFFVSHFALEKTLYQFSITRSERHQVLPNLVHDSFFEQNSSPIHLGHFRFLIICNLIPLKRVDFLLKTWAQVVNKYTNFRLSIAGEGPEKKRLMELTKTLEIEDTVCFLPRLKRSEVKEQIEKHHVLVSTSELETFGLTVAEAQSLGKPVVVTDSGGVRDIVEQTTGIICAPEKDSLARGLIDVYKNYGAYSSTDIREKTCAKFSRSVIYKKLHEFYTQS